MKTNSELRSGSDRDLVEQSGRGNRQAFTELINRYSRRIHAIAYQIVRNSEDAQDIAQEVFVKVFQSLSAYDSRGQFVHWLIRIAINQAIDYRRSKKMRNRNLENSQFNTDPHRPVNPGEAVESDQLRNIITNISRQLPDQQLQAFVLRDLQEMTVDEISEIMRCKASTVRVHLARARIYIREKIKTDYPEFIITDKRVANEL